MSTVKIKNSSNSQAPTSLESGELALGTLSGSEKLFFKNSENQIVVLNDWNKIINKPSILNLTGSSTDILMADGSKLGISSANAYALSGLANKIPVIKSDGVMEVGKYIDFHESTSSDYTTRLISENGQFKINNAKLVVPSTAADSFTFNGGGTIGSDLLIGGSLYTYTDLTVDGIVTIGTELNVFGNITASGEITAYSASDIKLKKNIKPIKSALDIIGEMNPVNYNWNDKAKELNSSKTDDVDAGLIAQELEEVLPNLVHTMRNGYKSIDYVKLVPYLIAGMKELQKQIDELKEKINIVK